MEREAQEHATKARAHQLWEENGSSHGKHKEQWLQAEREVSGAVHIDQSIADVTHLAPRHVDGISPFVF